MNKITSFVKKYAPSSLLPFLSFLYGKSWAYFLFLGNNYECVFCKKSFRKFYSMKPNFPVMIEKKVIGGRTSNSICPFCESLDRTRHVYLYLKNETKIFHKNLKILHVAPEAQLRKVLLSNPQINYQSIDLESHKAMNQMDLTNLKFENDEFDVIICNHVLEHIPNDRKAISELFRVLKKDGFAILQVPISFSTEKTIEDATANTPELREKKFGQNDHVRIYGRDYLDRLHNAGFSIKLYSFAEEHELSEVEKYSLIVDEKIFICSKGKE